MKSFLALLCLIIGVTSASAQSRFAGQYVALSYSNGTLVAAVNLKVKQDGSIVGHGDYVDFYSIAVKGQVNDDGTFTITEESQRAVPPYTGTFSEDGNKFSADLSTGNTVKGFRLPHGFKVAGVYIAETDTSLTGLFIVNKNHKVLGDVLYTSTKALVPIHGVSTTAGFEASTDNGIEFSATYDGKTISGSYSNGSDLTGMFSGTRF